jgi:hypothetical protein
MVVPKEHAYEMTWRAREVKKNEYRVRGDDYGKTLAQVMDVYKRETK